MVCVGTKHNNKGKGSICSIIVLTPTLTTKPQSPLSNLLWNVTPKLPKRTKPLLLRWRENEIAKYDPKINVIVIYPSQSIKSQCIYLYPVPKTSYESYLFTTYVVTLTLGSRSKQGVARLRAKTEAWESCRMLLGVQESVRE
jgi:hypothetical protein